MENSRPTWQSISSILNFILPNSDNLSFLLMKLLINGFFINNNGLFCPKNGLEKDKWVEKQQDSMLLMINYRALSKKQKAYILICLCLKDRRIYVPI